MGRIRKKTGGVSLSIDDLRQLRQIKDELGLVSMADTVRILIHLYGELHSLGINPLAAPELLKSYKSITKKIDELIKLVKSMKETEAVIQSAQG